ncbi:MAG TPA: NAD(P)/FAD-dependent oxidoreductase [Thermoleophilaceae bacterium]|nr:NAD(P)/FAD-dependent oxidoreductase [Thermoleophilaceae bacterium]
MKEEVEICIVGSGFSGLGMAVNLLEDGETDFVVLERGDDVGGTWHYNTYPGCGCDVPSHLYSFSFAPNPEWSQTYSLQPEIRSYLQRVADDFGVRPYLELNTTMADALWDEDDQRWVIKTDRGDLRAKVLVTGMGPLAEPRLPEIPGLDSFEGTIMHSARWDGSVGLEGKRIASIGTGASAIQYVPEVQKVASKLHVFQRTAPWVLPHTNRRIKGWEKRLYKLFPPLQRLNRAGVYAAREAVVVGLVKRPRTIKLLERVARRHLANQVEDPELREKVTPDYTIGCKRILPSNKWYPALSTDNVELVTLGVTEIKPNAIVDQDGVEREVDVILLGTGFQVADMPLGKVVTGRSGQTLDESWGGSPRAMLGATAPDFPNLFMLLGPNTGLGHNSMVYMIESQIAYVLDALRAMREHDAATVEVRPEAAAAFNQEVDRRHEDTVWTSGCSSWYLDDTGRNATLWPDWTFVFRRRTSSFNPAHYRLAS